MITIESPHRRGNRRKRVLTGTALIQVLEQRVLLALISITVTPVNPSEPAGETEQFTATGNYADGTTKNLTTQVTWASATKTVATISNAGGSQGLGTAVAMGTSNISAALGGVSGSTVFTVSAAQLLSIAVTPASKSIAAGLTQQFTATGTYTDKSTKIITTQVTWASDTTSVATISNTSGSQGLATGVAIGTAGLSAALSGVTGSATLHVSAANLVSIAVTPSNPVIPTGATEQFIATGTYSDNSTQVLTTQVSWVSSITSVASISNNSGSQGLATAINKGTSTITATSGSINGSTVLTVAALQSIAVTPVNPSVAVGGTKQFIATGTFSDNTTKDLTAQVTWASATTSVATISNASGSQGVATALAKGSSKITASLGGISGSTVLTVTLAMLQSIAVTPANPNLAAAGATQQFTATGTYSDSSTADLTSQVTWASATTSVATISNASGSQGLATAVATGSSSISATLGSVVGSTVLTVGVALQSIAVTPASPTIAKGATEQFIATGTYSDSSTKILTSQVTWASATTAVATISNTAGSQGLATGVGLGTSSISATLSSVVGSTTLTVAVLLQSIVVTPAFPASIAVGGTQQFTATGMYTDNSSHDITSKVTWASATAAVATISNTSPKQGQATGVAAGTTTISATLNGISGSAVLLVGAVTLKSLAVTPANPSVPAGLTTQLTATGTFSDNSTQILTTEVTWASATTTVATISNTNPTRGLATGIIVGTSTISAALAGVTGSTVLTVSPAVVVSIAVTPANPSLPVGLTQQFTATGTYSDKSTKDITTQVTWGSSSVAAFISNTPPSQGLATGFSVGTSTISATLGSISGSTVLNVTPAVVVSIAVSPANPSVPLGLTQQFMAAGTYSDGITLDITKMVTWASATISVATISNASGSQGLATSVGTGSSKISAKLGSVGGSTTMTVSPAVLVSLAVTPANPKVAVGAFVQLTATGTYSDKTTKNLTTNVVWSSNMITVATVSNSPGTQGLVRGGSIGTANIKAATGGISASTPVTVTAFAPSSSASLTPSLSALGVNPAASTDAMGALSSQGTDASTLNGAAARLPGSSRVQFKGLNLIKLTAPLPPIGTVLGQSDASGALALNHGKLLKSNAPASASQESLIESLARERASAKKPL